MTLASEGLRVGCDEVTATSAPEPAAVVESAGGEPFGSLAGVSLFRGAATDDLRRLAAVTYRRRLANGHVLFRSGDPATDLHVVLSGRVKLLAASPSGEELLLEVLGPGRAVGALSVVDGGAAAQSAVALGALELLCLPRQAVRELFTTRSAVAVRFAEELAARLRLLTAATADLVFLDLAHRLAKLLSTSGADGVADMPQVDVAARLGVTRQSLNRALRRLQEEGWVAIRRGGIEVLDAAALARFATS